MPISRQTETKHSSNLVKYQLVSLGVLFSIFAMTGCSTVSSFRSIAASGGWNDTVEALRNRSYAAKAYFRRQHNFGNQAHPGDFRAGFQAGYEAIAEGKPGCPPEFPPRQYWGWEYQSADGQSRTQAWFAGYPYGVQAAREEGVGGWSHLMGKADCGCGNAGCGGNCGNNGCGNGACSTGGCSAPTVGQPLFNSSEIPLMPSQTTVPPGVQQNFNANLSSPVINTMSDMGVGNRQPSVAGQTPARLQEPPAFPAAQ